MYRVSVVFLVLFLSAAQGQADSIAQANARIKMFKFFIKARDGIAPRESAVEREALLSSYRFKVEILKDLGKTVSRSSQACGRFVHNLNELHEQALESLIFLHRKKPLSFTQKLNQDQMMHSARVQSLVAFAKGFHYLIDKNSEAGMGTLDSSQSTTCQSRQRKQWQQHEERTLSTLIAMTEATFGDPGFKHKATEENQLFEEIKSKDIDDNHIFVASIAGHAVLTLLIWKYGPALLARALWTNQFFGSTRVFDFSARVLFIGGQIAVQNTLEENVLFIEDAKLARKERIEKWQEQMTFTEDFLETPLRSPTYYLKLLIEIGAKKNKATLLKMNIWKDDLLYAEKQWGSIDRALAAHEQWLKKLNQKGG